MDAIQKKPKMNPKNQELLRLKSRAITQEVPKEQLWTICKESLQLSAQQMEDLKVNSSHKYLILIIVMCIIIMYAN